MIESIQWLGYGSFLIQGPPIIYINPWRVTRRAFHADIILIGHDHYEHCSPADIEKLRGPDTIVIGNEKVAAQIHDCTILRPMQSMTFDRTSIKTLPAYTPGKLHHPKEEGGLGFLISLNFYDIYYAGDTGRIPEMQLIHPDIAILPIDGSGTMTVQEAAELVKTMKPRWVFPANWGVNSTTGASYIDAQTFKNLVSNYAEVIIPLQTR